MARKVERSGRIVEILRERNGASIRELAAETGVSEMTIRRDLEQLRLDNIVSLVHGAAIYRSNPAGSQDRDYHLTLEKGINISEKDRIGRAAAALVVPGDTIIIDVGTTTELMAKHLPQNLAVTVVCFTMNALMKIYNKGVDTLVMGGGYYHANTQLFESAETINLIRRIRATKLFLSAAGVSRELGLTCANQYEVDVKQACIESSLQKILLADSKKFGQIRPAYFAPLSRMDMVITDSGIDGEWAAVMAQMGIGVQTV
ncbi:MAG: DeoR/GlpR family DNA-binding transcription regulator [Treponema sp.]|jgi:DeoR family deoxyribose operon repressor|nr:DeoR/GlpR family DNA-binding transcription regulator [Treponema sp.]